MAKKTIEKNLDPRVLKIAQHIEKIRIDAGYTSYENFAIKHDINRMQYWRMEKGVNFTITSLLRVLDAHSMTMDEFFGGVEEEITEK